MAEDKKSTEETKKKKPVKKEVKETKKEGKIFGDPHCEVTY